MASGCERLREAAIVSDVPRSLSRTFSRFRARVSKSVSRCLGFLVFGTICAPINVHSQVIENKSQTTSHLATCSTYILHVNNFDLMDLIFALRDLITPLSGT